MAFPTSLDNLKDGVDRVTANLVNQPQMILVGPTVFNVKGYGAKGDNLTDDTVAIQAAITAAQAVPGGIVVFPPATYLIKATLFITNYITLVGSPMDGTILNFNLTVPGICINWSNPVKVRFGFGCRDLSLQGQSSTDGQTLFLLNNCQGIGFFNCTFGGPGVGVVFADSPGSFLVNCSYMFFQHCFWSNCGNAFSNFYATGSTENILFHHCAFSANNNGGNAATFGIQLAGPVYDVAFWQCSFDSVRLVMSGGTVSAVACHFEDPNSQLTTTSFVSQSGGYLTMMAGYYLTRTNTSTVLACSAGEMSVLGRWHATTVSGSVAALVGISGSAAVQVDHNDTAGYPSVTGIFSGTSTGICGINPLPETVSADRGDTAQTLIPGNDFQTQLWNTPLTAARAVTLDTSHAVWGARFRIVRGAAATGAFNLNVGSGPLKALTAAGQWVDVVLQQTGAWLEVASGTL